MDRKFMLVMIIGLIAVGATIFTIMFPVSTNCIFQDNVFIVVYRGAKPLDIAFQYLSQIIANVLKSNSSGVFNVKFPICYVDAEALPSEFKSMINQLYDFYPVFALRSHNMSKVGIPITNIVFDQYENYFYIPKPNITKYLYLYLAQYGFQYINISGVYATIITTRKPSADSSVTPIIGSINARYYIYIYEDVYCPYCAKMYYEVFPEIWGFINNNTIAILMKNFLVHEEAIDIQQYLVSLYIATRDSQLAYNVMKYIYGSLLNGSRPSLNQVKEFVENRYGGINIENYMDLAKSVISIDSEEAVNKYLIIGTPGIIIWDNKNGIGVVVTGFKSAEELVKLLNFLNNL